MQKQFAKVGEGFKGIGENMSKWVTLPIIGAGAAVLKMSGDFEAGMNKVGIATGATASEMTKMRDLALDIGKKTTMSASESASAMDMLAKAGMKTEDILAGGARAAVALAEAAGSKLDPAAAAITDTMKQFDKTAADLPGIINNITGAVNESKFGFEDFQLGMSQAGGVAASAGFEFEDFTAALAATASQFASGSDAGTSMKTFLLSLTPATKKARVAMEEAGFSAYDLQGNLKPLSQIAQDLQDKFGGLSEQDLNATFKEMFGTDAIRTAIGLMKEGSAGITEMQAKIAATNASEQAAQRMKGLNAEMEKLGGALETLAIKIGDSGLLSGITGIVQAVAEWVDWMSEANPEILKWGVVIAGVVAVIGPLLIGVGSIISAVGVMLPVITAIIAAVSAFAAIITAGAIPALISLAIALSPILIPLAAIAAAVGAAYLVWKNWDKIVPIVKNLYNAVKTWVMDKLGKVFDWLQDKLEKVGYWFFSLYDAVVGNSYIPDMVEGIGMWMGKLDGNMVQPAKGATEKVKKAFEKLRDDLAPIMEKLFPEIRALVNYKAQKNTLEEGFSKSLISAEALREGLIRLRDQYFNVEGPQAITTEVPGFLESIENGLPNAVDIIKIAAKEIDVQNVRIAKSFQDMATDTMASVSNFVNAIKKGGTMGILEGLFSLFTQLGSIGTFGKGIQTRINSPLPARAAGGPVSAGQSYLVGERGPEVWTAKRSGTIIPNDKLGGGRATTVHILPTPYFNAVVDGRADGRVAGAAPGIATAAAKGVQTNMQQSNFRSLP